MAFASGAAAAALGITLELVLATLVNSPSVSSVLPRELLVALVETRMAVVLTLLPMGECVLSVEECMQGCQTSKVKKKCPKLRYLFILTYLLTFQGCSPASWP